jgi:2-polyprenyl-3-methyl-5-hydroxy-6-metoxy-1,4-benzoquinol methylase
LEETTFHIHADLEDSHWWFVARARIVSALLARFSDRQDKPLILDVGCGTGGMVNNLSPRFNCLGVDTSETAIRLAREKYPSARFDCADAFRFIEERRDEVSCVLLMDVLEHIEDDRAFLRKIIDRLAPGSRILITVPANMKLWTEHDVTAHHFRRYEMETLAALWDGAEVQARVVSYFNTRLFPIIRAVRFLAKRLGVTWGRGKTDFELPPRPVNRLLTAIFAGELDRIMSAMNDGGAPYRYGASLLAILEKTGDRP